MTYFDEDGFAGSAAKRRIQAFHQRHGGVCFWDTGDEEGPGSFMYYPDGAIRDVNPLGLLAEPPDASTPEGEFRRASNIRMHYKLKLQKAVAQFDELNTRLSHTLPGDPKRELAELGRLQGIVEECRKEFNAADAKLNATALAKQRAAVKQMEEDRKQRMEEFQKQRRRIRV